MNLRQVLLDLAEEHVEPSCQAIPICSMPSRLALLIICWPIIRCSAGIVSALPLIWSIRICLLWEQLALAGTTFPIDRELTADLLDFKGIYHNSLDAVSDRDFILEFLSNSSILIMHLSRLCEELINWCSYEYGFVSLSDTFSTGSSIMPQKKNPDMAELIPGQEWSGLWSSLQPSDGYEIPALGL